MKIIEDVLPVEQADWLEEMLTSSSISWNYIRDGSRPDGDAEKVKLFPSFALPIYSMYDDIQGSNREMFLRFESLNHTVCAKAELDIRCMTRVRLGMHIPNPSWHGHHGPHCDQAVPHTVVLFYVTDTDGDTYFFDHEDKMDPLGYSYDGEDEYKIIDRVTPKKNMMVVFDGLTTHASSYPTKGQRITINYNFN